MPPPKAPRGKLPTRRRGIRLYGHHTTLALEGAFWDALKEIAAAQGITIGRLVTTIDSERPKGLLTNLSSAIRLFVLDYYQAACSPDQIMERFAPSMALEL